MGNGRKFSPNHMAEKIQAKFKIRASSSTAYMLRRELFVRVDSAVSARAAGGIIGEVRIRHAPSAAAQWKRCCLPPTHCLRSPGRHAALPRCG